MDRQLGLSTELTAPTLRATARHGGNRGAAIAVWSAPAGRALGGDAKPEFATVLKVLHALGISLVAQPKVA